MPKIPTAPFDRVLDRVDATWRLRQAPHHVILAQTGAGKTTLVKELLKLRHADRVLILDAKPAPDPAWDDIVGYPDTWGAPVTGIGPGFGSDAEGGGPFGYWFRLVAAPDREATGRALAHALDVVRDEGPSVASPTATRWSQDHSIRKHTIAPENLFSAPCAAHASAVDCSL